MKASKKVRKMRNFKKGVSPVIATVLLIAMVVVTALIIFLWFRGMTQEAVTKFGGENVELVCGEVEFDASYSGGTLYISNTGNVPIFGMDIKISKAGSYETISLGKSDGWSSYGLNSGKTFSGSIAKAGGATSLTLIPVLLGNAESGQKTYVCDARYGKEIVI